MQGSTSPEDTSRESGRHSVNGMKMSREMMSMPSRRNITRNVWNEILPFWDHKPAAVNIECDTLCATYNAHLSPGNIYRADMPRRKGNSIELAIATRLETLIRRGPKAPKVPHSQSEPIAFVDFAGPMDLCNTASATLVKNYNVSGIDFQFRITLKIAASCLHDGKYIGSDGPEDYELADDLELRPTNLFVICVKVFAQTINPRFNNHQAHVHPTDMDDLYQQVLAHSNLEQLKDSVRTDFPACGPQPEQTISQFFQHPNLKDITDMDMEHLTQLIRNNPATIAQMGLGIIKSMLKMICSRRNGTGKMRKFCQNRTPETRGNTMVNSA
jgi:hypothetical protein